MNEKIKSRFTDIFERGTWKSGESVSGSGSDKPQTRRIVEQLARYIEQSCVERIVDSACGDMAWQPEIIDRLTNAGNNVHFVGIDVVDGIVSRNEIRFGNDRRFAFRVGDLTADEIPACDLLIVRDVLVHFTDEMIRSAINNIIRSNVESVAITSFMNRRDNVPHDDESWHEIDFWRPVNLCVHPFNLPFPDDVIVEQCNEADGVFRDKCLCVWSVDRLRDSINIKS